MGFIPVEGQHYHNVASKIRMYLREFKGQDLEKAQSLLRKVINEFDESPAITGFFFGDVSHKYTEYPDGTYEISVDMTKQEEE